MPKIRRGYKDKKKERKKRAKKYAQQERTVSEFMTLEPEQIDDWVTKHVKNRGVRTVLSELARTVAYLRDYVELLDDQEG